MDSVQSPRLLVFCTVSTGVDALVQIVRLGARVEAIVGLGPDGAGRHGASGWIDVSELASRLAVPFLYVSRYDLNSVVDRLRIETLNFDLVWVSGWQRLIPGWVIEGARLGAIGGHGSPEGIHGGRGRSPQNWAIMLGCQRFELALFRITPGIDDGAVVATRTFFYNETDDISVSYKKASLCMAEMVTDVLRDPSLLEAARPQPLEAFYYPRRCPEDGHVDWSLTGREVWAHCRALTKPYPGLRTSVEGQEVVIWECLPFDDAVSAAPGTVSAIFEDGMFLVHVADGRLLVIDADRPPGINLRVGQVLASRSYHETLETVFLRHARERPGFPIAKRLTQVY